MNEIPIRLDMSHLSSNLYKSKIEVVDKPTEKTKVEKCHYELSDGSWICFETTYEKVEGEDWYKEVTTKGYCCDNPMNTKENNLKKLIEVLSK
jgi:hypothetical protein